MAGSDARTVISARSHLCRAAQNNFSFFTGTIRTIAAANTSPASAGCHNDGIAVNSDLPVLSGAVPIAATADTRATTNIANCCNLAAGDSDRFADASTVTAVATADACGTETAASFHGTAQDRDIAAACSAKAAARRLFIITADACAILAALRRQSAGSRDSGNRHGSARGNGKSRGVASAL